MKLPRQFYLQPTLKVAQELLGKYLVFKGKSARIIETEAYIGENDQACHASKGRTKRTETMYLQGGHAYIYLIYGMYYCFNIVTEKAGFPAAVLIRALDLPNTDGPGKLCREFGLSKRQNGLDLTASELYIEDRPARRSFSEGGGDIAKKILKTPRVGVAYAGADAKKLWRFVLSD